MRILMLAVALALGGTVLAPDEAQAQELSTADPLVVSLDAEAQAMTRLVRVLKGEVRAGHLEMSTEGKLSWQRAELAFRDLRTWGQAGDWHRAYAHAPEARVLAERGAREAFSRRASRPVKEAFRAYMDAVEPRVASVRDRIAAARDDGLMMQWHRAKATFEAAKEMAATGSAAGAWETMTNAVAHIDRLTVQVVWGDELDAAADRR